MKTANTLVRICIFGLFLSVFIWICGITIAWIGAWLDPALSGIPAMDARNYLIKQIAPNIFFPKFLEILPAGIFFAGVLVLIRKSRVGGNN